MRYLVLFFVLFLSSCGFQPLYKLNDKHYDVLAKIKVDNITGEKNYLLRNYLDRALNPNSVSINKEFILDVSVSYSVSGGMVLRDSTTTSSDMVLIANFDLKSLDSNEKIKSGSIRVVTNFEEPDSSYASFAQKNKAYDNALREVVRSIRGDILVALLNKNFITNENNTKAGN